MSKTKEYSGGIVLTSWLLLLPALFLLVGVQYDIGSLVLISEIALYIISVLFMVAWTILALLFTVWPVIKETAWLNNNNDQLEKMELFASQISISISEIVRELISCFIIYMVMSPILAIILSTMLAFGHGTMIYRFPELKLKL